MVLKIGIVSDLHCHNLKNNGNQKDSYLLTDFELPTFQDPFKSFEYLRSNEHSDNLDVDILVMPGDYANRACPEGLSHGFDLINKIKQLMNAKLLISTVGNHDVDSRNKYDSDPLLNFKDIIKKYPENEPLHESAFWEKGYFIIEKDQYRILIINTSHNHTNKDNTDHGDISEESLKYLEDDLKKFNDDKIGIAITHHCPIEHSHFNSGIGDFMYNGDDLSKIIDKYNFKLLIHGHKHDPRIRKMPGGINSPFIFSAGSFSAVQEKLLLGGANTFHVITVHLDGKLKGKGKIDTWFFSTAKGWNKDVKNQYINSTVGFGAVLELERLSEDILDIFTSKRSPIISWNDVEEIIPDINHLMPSDLEKLRQKLLQLKIHTSSLELESNIFLQLKN